MLEGKLKVKFLVVEYKSLVGSDVLDVDRALTCGA